MCESVVYGASLSIVQLLFVFASVVSSPSGCGFSFYIKREVEGKHGVKGRLMKEVFNNWCTGKGY